MALHHAGSARGRLGSGGGGGVGAAAGDDIAKAAALLEQQEKTLQNGLSNGRYSWKCDHYLKSNFMQNYN